MAHTCYDKDTISVSESKTKQKKMKLKTWIGVSQVMSFEQHTIGTSSSLVLGAFMPTMLDL